MASSEQRGARAAGLAEELEVFAELRMPPNYPEESAENLLQAADRGQGQSVRAARAACSVSLSEV